MLATTKQVRFIVNTLANMRGDGYYRRVWADKAKDTTKRNMAFRFFDSAEADKVAEQLQMCLRAQGYTNKVKRTDCVANYTQRTDGGYYVRVQAVFD